MGGRGWACVRGRTLDLTLYRKGGWAWELGLCGEQLVCRWALGLCGEGL